jgi:sec-independent protein translocase protein TatC
MPKLDSVFSLYTKFLIAMAAVFQMPTLVFFLAKMRVITARFLISQFKYAILLIFIVSAVITPTGDPVTQTVFAAPMIGLYVLGIAIAWVVGPKRLKE